MLRTAAQAMRGAGKASGGSLSALTEQRRGFKDGKKAMLLSWSHFASIRTHGGPASQQTKWEAYGGAPQRKADSYLGTPIHAKRFRPFLDPYKFKYVGVKVDERGKPILDKKRQIRESQIRHDFRYVLDYWKVKYLNYCVCCKSENTKTGPTLQNVTLSDFQSCGGSSHVPIQINGINLIGLLVSTTDLLTQC